jgi:CheY-like chemotaxis protein
LLEDTKVLVIDDDVRNIFALTLLLERHRIQVYHATNGKEGIDLLQKTSGIGAVLMDIMMPEMDGYEATRRIRSLSEYKALPIIALTAKAMRGDRQRCVEAGASDYITKPADPERLLSVLRVKMHAKSGTFYHPSPPESPVGNGGSGTF